MNNTEKTNTPVISVVIPVYNVEKWLTECLDSVLAQDIEDMEIICVDDGSTDKSPEILKEYAERDGRIKIITKENEGVSLARNTGVREARGKYLYFMDSDDIIVNGALKLCIDDMEERNLEYVCFNVVAFGDAVDNSNTADNMNIKYYKRDLDFEKIYDGKELYRKLAAEKSVVVTVWSCVLLRSAFIDNELWFRPAVIYEDEFWMFSTLMTLSRCGCINRILYKNRMRTNSITHSEYTFINCYGAFRAACDIREYLASHPDCINSEDYGYYEYERPVILQRIAINRYRAISDEERKKRFELEPDERTLFEQTVVYPAEIQINLSENYYKRIDAEKENAALQRENEELTLKVRKLKKQKKKLKKRIKKIKKSSAYRIGSAITWLPQKIKSFFNSPKKQTKTDNTEKQKQKLTALL